MAAASDLADQRGGEDAVLRVGGDGGLWKQHGVGHAALHVWRPSATDGGGSGAKHEEEGGGSVSVLRNLLPNRLRSARPFIAESCRPLRTYGIVPATTPLTTGHFSPSARLDDQLPDADRQWTRRLAQTLSSRSQS